MLGANPDWASEFLESFFDVFFIVQRQEFRDGNVTFLPGSCGSQFVLAFADSLLRREENISLKFFAVFRYRCNLNVRLRMDELDLFLVYDFVQPFDVGFFRRFGNRILVVGAR